ncbi:uncharacterized protein LOC123548375 [Mercenaria mercenaria]|uniref:uncharacterized protein LOC123548375 n=1 Tax=Mercenaria mercenaria TaxID=6596 RepID=UPI00234F5197|nr:uncharacterized protein LOC123548375 [Mercenaria mercenaria]XP_053402475.1 uncharacterized protein LOC123548375 [Mercenaria mercenaria]
MAEGGRGWPKGDDEKDRDFPRLTDSTHKIQAKMKPKLPSKKEIESNLDSLKQIVVSILKKHPGGVKKSVIWNLVQKETRQTFTSADYGVPKMNKVLEIWSDTVTFTGSKDPKIVLRRGASSEDRNSSRSSGVLFNESNFPPLSREWTPPRGPKAPAVTSLKDAITDKLGASDDNGNIAENKEKVRPSGPHLTSKNVLKDDGKAPLRATQVGAGIGISQKDINASKKRSNASDSDSVIYTREKLASPAPPLAKTKSGVNGDKALHKETDSLPAAPSASTRVIKTAKRKSSKNPNENVAEAEGKLAPLASQPAPTMSVSSTEKIPVTGAQSPLSSLFGFQWTLFGQYKTPDVRPSELALETGDPSIIGGKLGIITQNVDPVMAQTPFSNQDALKTTGFTTGPNVFPENHINTIQGSAHHNSVTSALEGPRRYKGWQDDAKAKTVTPIDRDDFETKKIDVRPVYVAKGRKPSKEQVNNVAKECIEILADADLFVTQERVEKLVCQRFGCHRIQELGFRFVDQIECVNELNRLVSKINVYIIAFVKTRSICTLHELKDALKEYATDDGDFSSLKTGPLQRFPVVYQQFRFPPDQAEIPEITSMDILDHFSDFLNKNGLWTKKLELEPFMDYLVENYSAENAYMLGVRIRSLALAVTTLKKAHRDSASNRRAIRDHFEDELRNEIGEAFRKFRTSILQTGEGEGMEIRKHYLKMKPEFAIMEIFDKFNILHMVVQAGEIKLKKATRFKKAIEDFLTCMRDNELGKNLLHLAICMSNTTVEETVKEIFTPVNDETNEGNETPAQQQPPPRKDVLLGKLKTYIERCLNAGALSLIHLDRIEEKLLEDFDFPAFSKMGYGRFLEFLLAETKQMLEEGGGLTLGSVSGGGGESDTSFKPSQTDLVEFIKQFKQHENIQPEQIEEALCRQYNVTDVRHLGHGNISRLLSYADKPSRHMYDDFTVFYESAFLRSIRGSSNSNSKVGILGHQSKDAARFCLHSCPLLENLADWSQWSLVFEPELGKLKDFVQRYGGVTTKTVEGGKVVTLDFLALEIKPGELIKLVSTTSPDCVAEALRNHDVVSTAGHLVSMAIAYKGVESMPIALLSGHVKTVLLQMHASEPTIETNAGPATLHSAAMFVLQCLLRIPTNFCVAFANQLFLEPLGQVVGSSKSKQLLIQLCSSSEDLNKMIKLGCLLGIHEWTDVIQQKCQPPTAAVQISANEADDFFENDNEYQEDEELVDEYDAEDVDEILAGEEDEEVMNNEMDMEHLDNERNHREKKDGISTEDAENEDNENSSLVVDTDKPVISSCEDIINQIRRDEFGVGVHLNEDGERLMKVQQERLGRSLDRLSKDLYSKDTHFVLELVQNADDNSYPESLLNRTADGCPSVKFVIENDGIYVLNNELGFREKDVRALCDVGRSTKGKHKYGYIGQKGIGFKSVFRITDAPEVHSNGYHIKFDVNSGPMGYILPHWVPEEERISQDEWMTQIILRLKTDMRLQTRTLAARFNDLHPSLLLFLHRLRQITIENKVEHSVQTMKRRDVGDNVIEIQHSDGCDRWLVIKKMLDASNISLQTKSGAEVESTEIALAFPLKNQGKKSTVQMMPPKQPVFAFLPLRSYGFRFIIQGDFDVPSSREDVDRDSSWNQWLRNEIPTVFIDTLEIFRTHSEFSSMEAVCAFLQFVPMEDEVMEFFKPVASDILKKLKAKTCIPTQPNKQGVISWKMPSQTVRVRDPLVRSVITADLLEAHLNLFYLHLDIASVLNPALTSCLGIETLTSDHLFQLGKALIVNMGTHCKDEDVILISKWMACLYRSLDEFHHDDTILPTLKLHRVLPLSNRELVSLQDKTVFHPIPNSSAKRQKGKGEKDPMYYLQQDVNSLHPLLLNTGDVEVNSQVHKLLLRLGVKQLSPSDVINHHIIPVLKSDAWQSKSKGTLVSYIVYIKEQTDKQTSVCNIDEVKDVAMVMTNNGYKNPSREPVQFPPQYGNQINLQEIFKGYEWTLLDPCYLPHTCSQPMVISWQEFFRKLGVDDFLSVRKKDVHIKRDDLANSYWNASSLLWPKDEPEYIVQDYYSVELEGLIKNNKYPSGEHFERQMRHLCTHLDRNWDSRFSKYCKTHVVDKEGKLLKETDTSLSILLQTCQWLPAEEAETKEVDGHLMREVRIVMKEPNTLYLKSNVVQNLLSDKVLYLDQNLTSGSFLQFLGLKNYVSLETVKSYLLQWCERTKDDFPASFFTSLEHMKHVYAYLGNELKKHDLQDLLRNNPVFFVPDARVTYVVNPGEIVKGKMMNRNEIWLMEKTGLFDQHRQVLEDFHSDLALKRNIIGFYHDRHDVIELFKQEGKIDAQPKVEEYIELLCLLCNTSSPKDTKILSDVLYIFSTVGQALVTPPEGMPDEQTANMVQEAMRTTVKKKLQREEVFPTNKQIWVSLADHPMIPDNRDWEKMFADKAGVHFLDMEDKSDKVKRTVRGGIAQRGHRNKIIESRVKPDMIDVVIEVCGIKKLSEAVDIKPTPEMIEPCLPLQAYFSQIVSPIQQYLMVRFDKIYQQLELCNTKEMLAEAKFYQTSKLEVSYWLNYMSQDTFVIQEEKCVIHPPEFYFHREHLKALVEIHREIARYFSRGNTDCSSALRSFLSELYTIVSGETDDTVDELLERHGADGIEVTEEEQWMVEAPILPEPDLPEEAEQEEIPSDEEEESELNVADQDGELQLRAWPPVSNSSKTQLREPTERPSSNIWPPPQAKDYMKSVKDLPANVRMVAPSQGDTKAGGDSDTTDTAESAGAGNRVITYVMHPDERSTRQIDGQTLQETFPTEMLNNNALVPHVEQDKKTDIPRPDDVDMRNSDDIPEKDDKDRTKSYDMETRNLKGLDENRPAQYEQEQLPGTQRSAGASRHHKTGGRYHFSRGQPIIKGDPIWTFMATDYIYDELGSGKDLCVIDTLTLSEDSGGPEIGQWGEALVAQYLQRQKDLGNILDYSWKNSEEETGCPFDFEIQLTGKSGNINNYIEVKSTVSEDKEIFEISLQQIQFADHEKENFHIYRVFNAGNPERVKLIRIANLDLRLEKKQVKLCMLI